MNSKIQKVGKTYLILFLDKPGIKAIDRIAKERISQSSPNREKNKGGNKIWSVVVVSSGESNGKHIRRRKKTDWNSIRFNPLDG